MSVFVICCCWIVLWRSMAPTALYQTQKGASTIATSQTVWRSGTRLPFWWVRAILSGQMARFQLDCFQTSRSSASACCTCCNLTSKSRRMTDTSAKLQSLFVVRLLWQPILPVVRCQKRHRSCQETLNKRLKQFTCLSARWRHSFDYQGDCFNAVVVLTQIAILEDEPLFDM